MEPSQTSALVPSPSPCMTLDSPPGGRLTLPVAQGPPQLLASKDRVPRNPLPQPRLLQRGARQDTFHLVLNQPILPGSRFQDCMGAWAVSTLRQACLEGPSDSRDPVSLQGLARTVFIHLYAPGSSTRPSIQQPLNQHRQVNELQKHPLHQRLLSFRAIGDCCSHCRPCLPGSGGLKSLNPTLLHPWPRPATLVHRTQGFAACLFPALRFLAWTISQSNI